jgi:uncharacterized radical SAM superfamily protein
MKSMKKGTFNSREMFHILLIKPTHYDDDGYPIQWLRSLMPSNSLACLNGIASDCVKRQVLGEHVQIKVHTLDETNRRIQVSHWVRRLARDRAKSLVALVGVQSNQFPRAVDLARQFLDHSVPVCIGGFHAAGVLAMLPEATPEIKAAQTMGISFFIGEAEQGRFDPVLRDAYAGRLKPIYNHLDDRPELGNQPLPFLPPGVVQHTLSGYSSFDLGRGCPFACSFCTIKNVQGQKSRFRTADDLEAIIRANTANGIHKFFLTDDNLARNRNWEACLDRLIELREKDNIRIRMAVQLDASCYRIPHFIEKAVKAGVDNIFIGIESLNPANLSAIKKNQNKVADYRRMMLAWKKYPVVITVGFIIGFANDTEASILRDIDIIKRELPIDLVYFTNLTPLPGSEDHKRQWQQGVWMDPDLNKYDLNHRVTHHPRMSDAQWDRVYHRAWPRFYTFAHMETILRRMTALGSNKKLTTVKGLVVYREFRRLAGVHPLEGGLWRLKFRKDRRLGLPLEHPLVFYPTYVAQLAWFCIGVAHTYLRLRWKLRRIWRAPDRYDYRDTAITPPS